MGQNSRIEWTHHTFNPWMGCTKVSPACQHCYAERDMDHRYGKVAWGPRGTRVKTADANWRQPLKWNREAERRGIRPRVFCSSLADVFEDWDGPILDHHGQKLFKRDGRIIAESEVDPDDFTCLLTMDDLRQRLFALIDMTPCLDWLVLTKRPENIGRFWGHCGSEAEPMRRPNVWLGCSVESQEYADKRIPELLSCRDLAPVLFLSCEPLLGPVSLSVPWMGEKTIPTLQVDWVIAGGESGPSARPSHPDWFRSLRDQCQDAEVAFHFKQWGEWLPFSQACTDELRSACAESTVLGQQSYMGARIVSGPQGPMWGMSPGISPAGVHRIGKKKAGRLLDGRTWDEVPASAEATL